MAISFLCILQAVEIEDLLDENGGPAGTRVTLKIPIRTIGMMGAKQMATT
jgi:hypothetical protein